MNSRQTIHIFDLLRGVAALSVASFHLNIFIEPFWMSHGYLAVDLFFLMSGCVIELAYAERLKNGMSFGDFMRIRFTRLYPLYALGTAIGIGLVFIGIATGMSKNWTGFYFGIGIAAAALFIPFAARSSDDVAFPLNQPAYSLFYEIIVNAIYALLFRRITDFFLKVTILSAAAAMVAATIIHGTIDIGYRMETILPGFPRAIFGFFLGVYIARMYGKSKIKTGNMSCAMILIVVLISFCGPMLFQIESKIWDLLFILIVYPIVIRLSFSIDLGARFHGIAAALGRSSYAIYAIHVPIFALAANAFQILKVDQVALAPYFGIVLVAVVFVLSLIIDRWFDAPIRRRLKNFFDARRTMGRTAGGKPA
ncbi:acyltransferase family protein [Bosea sp. BH3]|uniref:acyltransferase family protein n=1 Tax=Bosea sp. BH3 TaxID=2871701 RepID=UPI0021CB0BE4|nr:acyltransferase [Bosea sp. BH3]MCU4181161.1 acyltransferase [Bosea sp. BH3]